MTMTNTIEAKAFDKVNALEYSIDCCGLSFLCIIGRHINGGFVAITNWGVAAELSAHPGDVGYNSDQIYEALSRSNDVAYLPRDNKARNMIAYDLAKAIDKVFSKNM